MELSNHKPISLAKTIYDFSTSTLTLVLSTYGIKHQILHISPQGFRKERHTTRHIQKIIVALEDSKFTNQDIYLIYLDFKNAIGSIDHPKLLFIMEDLGYSTNIVKLLEIYTLTPQLSSHVNTLGKLSQCTYKKEPYKETF